jgi:signal transduction histidine kinase/ActR/RegA family two-component response regulator/integral membrane sensor domain MASE1
VIVGLWLITPRPLQRALVLGAAAGLFAGNLMAGRPLAVNLTFIVANVGEAWLVATLLRRWSGEPAELRTLKQIAQFILVVGSTVTIGGALGSAVLQVIPGVGTDYLADWGSWIRARGVGMLTVAPAVVALGSLRRAHVRRMWREGKLTLLALAAAVAATYGVVGLERAPNDLLALLVLLALVYPLVLFVAARSEPVWTYLALLLATLAVVWRLGHGGGMFRGNIEVAQAFLFVSSLWSLTLAVVMDQQRRARNLAQASERSMREALAAGRGFTFDFDPRHDSVVRTDPFQIMAPFDVESGSQFFERIVPEDRSRLQQLVGSLSPARPMYETTYGSRRPDGRLVWLQERGVGEFDERGALVRLQGLTMDVSARREAEEALREADRKKDRFIATLAHELRNPLAPIRTAAELLGSPRAGTAELEWARQVIRRQVGHMATLLDDLLDVARITRGKLELRKQSLRLDTVIETAVEVAQPLIEQRRIALDVQVPSPAPRLEADPLRLAQVVSNLLTNAAKYSDPGGRISLTVRARTPTLVDIVVHDDGIGIPPEALDSIFQVFSQVEGAMGRSQGGLGIGLSLVKGLVELHGGSVEARSDGPGRGSEFVVTLPCLSAAEQDDRPPPAVEEAQSVPPPGKRVLVVDDNHDAADSLALVLQIEGHDVRTADCGRAALEVAREFAPEVVVLDLGLPDVSGFEVAQALRKDVITAGASLIALTGWGQDEHRRRAQASGFDHHFTKPVDPELLAQAIAAATRGSGTRG